jgi:transposase
MDSTSSLTVERSDDIPLLLAQLERMGLRELLDRHFPVHGSWLGLSLGWTTTFWLTHVLSEGDHRLSQVEPWAVACQETLQQCTGRYVNRLDLTDDRLAAILRALADDPHWGPFEAALTSRLLRVYDLAPERVRLDMTTASSAPVVTPEGLFQWGYSKDHRPDLPQVKISLAALDPLGLPLATAVVPGNQADDRLYQPLVQRVRASLGSGGRLYIGDVKMAALATRALVHEGGDYYLCPLPAAQLPAAVLDAYLGPVWAGTQPLTVLVPGAEPDGEPEAEGFELAVPLTARVGRAELRWCERRVLVRSPARARSEETSLRQRVAAAEAALRALNERGRGKRGGRDPERLRAAVRGVLRRHAVAAWVQGSVGEVVTGERRVRGYRGQPARVVVARDWQVTVQVDTDALAATIRRLGWRVYASDAPESRLPLGAVVAAYRGQWVIERGFERLKGRPLSLTPLYLQKEAHVVGLVRLLSLALRVLCVLEFVARRSLAAVGESLAGLYAGQPRRATAQPTSEALLRAFRGLCLVLLPGGPGPPRRVTALSALQQRILALLGLPADTYSRLAFNSLHGESE